MEAEVENNQFYEVWDTEIPEISPRSILYRLSPVGIGTANVESLSGYISRLAQEHSLSPVVLLKNSVRDLSELPKTLLQNSISAGFAGSLNGFSENTEIIVDILQKATLRDDIYRTTLIPWRKILSKQKLLKNHSAWCPVCFDEQKRNHGIVYEKLLWTFNTVNACRIHEIPLAERCPHCRKKSKVLSGRSRPGYCSGCLKWLGSNLIRFDEFSNFRDDGEKKKSFGKRLD